MKVMSNKQYNQVGERNKSDNVQEWTWNLNGAVMLSVCMNLSRLTDLLTQLIQIIQIHRDTEISMRQ